MSVDHRGAHIFVSLQFQNRANVAARFQQVRGETVPKRMATGVLVDLGTLHGGFHSFLCRAFMCVMSSQAGHDAGGLFVFTRITAKVAAGKDVLPMEGTPRFFVFVGQTVRQPYPPGAHADIFTVLYASTFNLAVESVDQPARQRNHSIFFALAVSNDDLMPIKVDGLHP